MSRRIEAICRSEAKRLFTKDKSKAALVASLYATSVLGQEKSRSLRAGYFFMRYLDDLLDGEMAPEYAPAGDQKEYVLRLQHQIEIGTLVPNDTISQLGAYAFSRIGRGLQSPREPYDAMANVMRAMVFDYDRRLERATCTAEQLHAYYGAMLDSSLDGALMLLGSARRSTEVPGYVLYLGRLYSLRDLEKDWQLGIINVPSEVMAQAGVTAEMSYEAIQHNQGLTAWRHEESAATVSGMEGVLRCISRLPDWRAKLMVGGLGRSAIRSV